MSTLDRAMPKPLLTPSPSPSDLLAEVLALRPDIERILTEDPLRRDTSCIQDCVQIVLLKVSRHVATYRPHPDGMRPWVTRIAKNVKFDAWRAKRKQRAALGVQSVDPDETQHRNADPERHTCARALLRQVIPVIQDMPEPLRTVLVLAAFARLDHEQIAVKVGISVPATKMRLVRAREYLRDRVGSLDDHLAILAPVPTMKIADRNRWSRQVLTLGGHIVHLWPPLLATTLALSQVERPESDNSMLKAAAMQQVDNTVVITGDVMVRTEKPLPAPSMLNRTTPPLAPHRPTNNRNRAVAPARAAFNEHIAPLDPMIGDDF